MDIQKENQFVRKKNNTLSLPEEIRSEQFVCTYRDEAKGAKPIPLLVTSPHLKIRLSSDYFVDSGVKILLSLNEKQEIAGMQMGDRIFATISDLMSGVRFMPLGLIPAHIMQFDSHFDPAVGGVLRFGHLKRIFCWKTMYAVITTLIKRKRDPALGDLISHWRNIYGVQIWGEYEVIVRRDPTGRWSFFSKPEVWEDSKGQISELITHFNVNSKGVVTGLNEMTAIVSE